MHAALIGVKELAEMLAGQRGGPSDIAVTWGDLIDIGLIKPNQVPPDIGSLRSK